MWGCVRACLHVSGVSRVAPSVFCWAYNKCQLIKIPTTSSCNLSSVSLKSDTVPYSRVNFNQLIDVMNASACSHLALTPQTVQGKLGGYEIPPATSARLGWVKESSLWLLSLWITPQYGITLQWMSADTIGAAQPWTIQQRLSYRAAMKYLLIWYQLYGRVLLTVIHTCIFCRNHVFSFFPPDTYLTRRLFAKIYNPDWQFVFHSLILQCNWRASVCTRKYLSQSQWKRRLTLKVKDLISRGSISLPLAEVFWLQWANSSQQSALASPCGGKQWNWEFKHYEAVDKPSTLSLCLRMGISY